MKEYLDCKKPKITRAKVISILFYISIIAYPVIQFSIMWIGVNINSLMLSLKKYDVETYQYTYVGFANFKEVISNLINDRSVAYALRNSLIWYSIVLFVCMPSSILISFYIYKRFAGSGFFKVVLYIPSFISGVVLTFVFKVIADRAYPEIMSAINGTSPLGLLANPKSAVVTVILYNLYFSLGSNVLMYVGGMSSIDDSIIEAARLDGASLMQEFRFVTIPSIFNTISVFLVVGVAGIFTADLNLFLFFDLYAEPEYFTFGYYMFRGVKSSTIAGYPYFAAFGLVLTVVAVPITFTVRYLLSRLDPMKDGGA